MGDIGSTDGALCAEGVGRGKICWYGNEEGPGVEAGVACLDIGRFDPVEAAMGDSRLDIGGGVTVSIVGQAASDERREVSELATAGEPWVDV